LFHCLPSQLDKESAKRIEAIDLIERKAEEKRKREAKQAELRNKSKRRRW